MEINDNFKFILLNILPEIKILRYVGLLRRGFNLVKLTSTFQQKQKITLFFIYLSVCLMFIYLYVFIIWYIYLLRSTLFDDMEEGEDASNNSNTTQPKTETDKFKNDNTGKLILLRSIHIFRTN